MNSLLNVPEQPLDDPKLIESAPVLPDGAVANESVEEVARLNESLADLSARLAAADAEKERLEGEISIERVKARMMEPYANRVFWFVVFYCGCVGFIIICNAVGYIGGAHDPFKLSDTVLGIIAGSTAASVIGLIGIVVSGLFGSKS